MKILCLFVRHGSSSYPEALTVLDRWYETHGLLAQRTLWIIDNALPSGAKPCISESGTILRAGDNDAWEFSSWARAVGEARNATITWDIVHFVTSAFNTIYTGYLQHFFPEMLDYVCERRVCLGHIDTYRSPIRMGKDISQAWIRTCFFFLPWSLAQEISPWVSHPDPALFFAEPNSRRFRLDAPIDRTYQEKITTWLEGHEIGGHSWHSPVASGAKENARFQRKTLAILNEHSLAITLRKAGIPLTDLCWLHSFQTTPVSIISDPPSEMNQEQIRRNILGFQNDPKSFDQLPAG